MTNTREPACLHCARGVSSRGVQTPDGLFCSKDCAFLGSQTPPHKSPVYWMWQVLPPLPILLGVFYAMDIATAIVLGPMIVCGLVWACSLPIWLQFRIQKRPIYRPRYLRGLLSVVFLLAVFVATSLSLSAAVSFAADAAHTIQEQCVSQGRCPEVPRGWEPIAPTSASCQAGMTISYRLDYVTTDEGQSFSIRLRRNIDDAMTWFGGVHTQVLTPSDPPPPSGGGERPGGAPNGAPPG